ncbi:MAG: hypothetical protein ABIE03_01740 [Patescibacteria group bacterium]
MIYKKGKGARVYYNTGFRNYGCLISLLILPIQLIILVLMKMIRRS